MNRRAFASSVLMTALVLAGVASVRAARAAGERYTTRGTIKSFGKGRAYVNIAHEKIAGFMDAMTMAFKPQRPDQLAGLAVGDAVTFTFVVTAEGDHVIERIART